VQPAFGAVVLKVNLADQKAHVPIATMSRGEFRAGELIYVRNHLGVNLQTSHRSPVVPDGQIIAATLDGNEGQKKLEG
jgi:hypothetical protein